MARIGSGSQSRGLLGLVVVGVLLIAWTATALAQPEVRVRIDGTEIFNGGTFDLGTVSVAGTLSHTIVIDNVGITDVTGWFQFLGEGSNVTPDPFASGPAVNFTIVQTDSVTINSMSYNPTADGAFSSAINITSDDPDWTNYKITLSGTADGTPPGVSSIVRANASPTNASSVDYTVTFDEAVSDIETGDFALAKTGTADGTISSVSASSGTIVAVTVNAITGDGTLGLNFDYDALDSVADAVGNLANADFTGQTYTIDNDAPGPTSFALETPATSPTNADTLVFRATFDEDVQSVDTSDFTATGTTATIGVASVSDSVYDITVSGGNLAALDGTVGIDLAGGQNITDLAGNALPVGEPGTDETYTIDNDAPGPTSFALETPATSPTNADTLVFRATFDEDVQSVDTSDFTATGTTATIGVASVSDSVYDITVSGGNLAALDGTVGIDLAGGQNITDLAGNALPVGEPGTDETYTVDNTAPSVTAINRADDNPTNATSVDFTATFDEAVSDIENDDFVVGTTGTAAGTISSVSASSGTTVTVTVNAVSGDGHVALDFDPTRLDSVVDSAGNAATAYFFGQDYEVDNTNPTVSSVIVSDTLISESDAGGTFTIAVEFSEPMDQTATPSILFDADLTSTLAFQSDTWPAADTYRITYAVSDGNVTDIEVWIDVEDGVDLAGNPQDNFTAVDEFGIDTVKPSVLTVAVDTDPMYEGDLTQQVTVTFDEAMDTGTAPTITFGAGTFASSVAGAWSVGDTVWTETFTLTDNNEEIAIVTVDVTGAKDAALNDQEPYTALDEFDIDTVAPSVSGVTVDTDPVYEGDLTQFVTVTFNEAMNPASSPTITFRNAANTAYVGTWASNSDGAWSAVNTVWTETFTLTDNDEEIDDVQVSVGDAQDAAGNYQGGYGEPDAFDIDTVKPSALTVAVDTDPMYEGDLTQQVTVTFDEAMDTGTAPTITFGAGTFASSVAGAWSVGDTVWTETFTLTDNNEEIAIVTVDVTGAKDAALNDQEPYTALDEFDIDTVAPSVSGVTVDTDPVYEGDLTQFVTVTFNEAMNPASSPTITFRNAANTAYVGTWASNSDGAWSAVNTVWTETFTLTDNDEEIDDVQVSVGDAQDAAGNYQGGYGEPDAFDIDTVKPSALTVAVDTDPMYEGDLTQQVTVTFDEAMDTGTAPTITFGAGTFASSVAGAWSVGDTVWTETFTLTDNDEEIAIVTVDVTGAKDAALNDQEPYTAVDEFDIDTVKPSTTSLTENLGMIAEANVGNQTFTLTLVYDEAMDTGIAPTISFPTALEDPSATLTLDAASGWSTSTLYVARYDVADTNQEIDDIDVRVTGAIDEAGNVQEQYDEADVFSIDTVKPLIAAAVGSVTVGTNPVYEGDLIQEVTVSFSEAMDTATIPSIVFSEGIWTEETATRSWSNGDMTFDVTYTLTDNNEEYYSTSSDIVTVDVIGGKDAAGNNQENYGALTEFDIDTVAPRIIDITSTTDDGCYTVPDTINVTMTFSEDVTLSGDLNVTLDVDGLRTVHVTLVITTSDHVNGPYTASGTYTVQDEENSCDLTVDEVNIVAAGGLVDWAGNYEGNPLTLPPTSYWRNSSLVTVGNNLAGNKQIIVDTTIPVAIQDPNGNENRDASTDTDIVDVRLDPFGRYRLTVRENTPVYLDVKFNDTDLPCAVLLRIYDIPQPPEWGYAWFDDPAGNIRYAPDQGYIGPDEFTYRIYDACGNISQEATVYVEVVRQLVSEDQYLAACANDVLDFEVSVTDLFVPEAEFSFSIDAGPFHGVVVGDLSNTAYTPPGLTTETIEMATLGLRYVPSAGYVGTDLIRWVIGDPFGGNVAPNVNIIVSECPESGAALDIVQGEQLRLLVPLTFESVLDAAWASVTLQSLSDGTTFPDALSAVWDEDVGRYVLILDSEALPLGTYELTVPLGNGETVVLTIEVGEEA